MLARKHKLDPATLFGRPHQTTRGSHMTLAHAAAAKKEGSFAVVVSAKAAPSAILRHRVKRILFAALAAKRPYPRDVVVTLKKVPAQELGPMLRGELQELFERIPL